MTAGPIRARLLAGALLTTAASPATAQVATPTPDAAATPAPAAADAPAPASVPAEAQPQDIVVTGSRIARSEYAAAEPPVGAGRGAGAAGGGAGGGLRPRA